MRRSEHRQPCRLCGSQHRVTVFLREHSFDGHRIGSKSFDFFHQAVVDGQQTQILGGFWIGTHHIHVDKRKPAVCAGFDHADPAASQPGVDAKNNHA